MGAEKTRKLVIKRVDLIVIGAGLAGTAIAWNAHWRGLSIAIIDRADSATSSRVAAGLVTPITGSRAAASWRWDEFYPVANRFYRAVEKVIQKPIWIVEPALRVFASEGERELLSSKWIDRARADNPDAISAQSHWDLENTGLRSPHGACSFTPAARLQTLAYLTESQRYFQQFGAFHVANLDCDREIHFALSISDYPVEVPSMELVGKKIVFCQGTAARENRFFSDRPLHPARGDILLIESKQVQFEQIVHHHAWAVPVGSHRFLVGATYDRIPFLSDHAPSDLKATRFRSELETRWESMVEGSFSDGSHTVLEQRWAVRPASYDRHPLIGSHDRIARAYCLNGLGSKGTLLAPRLSEMLIEAMDGASIDPTLLRSRRK